MLLGAATTVTQVLSVIKCSGFIGAGHKVSVICRRQDASSGKCTLNVVRGNFFLAVVTLRLTKGQ